MNYAIPLYQCQKDETPGRVASFSCTVEIGGIRYIGAAARTKKEAEIKAARTALLAIQSSASQSAEKPFSNSQLTVIPCKKRGIELVVGTEEAANNLPKAKKARLKKKVLKKKLSGDKPGISQVDNAGNLESFADDDRTEPEKIDAAGFQEGSLGTLAMEALWNPHYVGSDMSSSEKVVSAEYGAVASQMNGNYENGKPASWNSNQNENGNPDIGTSFMFSGDITALMKEVNELSRVG